MNQDYINKRLTARAFSQIPQRVLELSFINNLTYLNHLNTPQIFCAFISINDPVSVNFQFSNLV